jgi:branched-subunit amino acid transport protein
MSGAGFFDGINWWNLFIIAGLALLTVLTRGLFLFSDRPLRLPALLERGLQYTPIAALAAVVAPDVLMAQGELFAHWRDARLFGAAAGMAMFYWSRSVLATILMGMAVYMPLHIGLGW